MTLDPSQTTSHTTLTLIHVSTHLCFIPELTPCLPGPTTSCPTLLSPTAESIYLQLPNPANFYCGFYTLLCLPCLPSLAPYFLPLAPPCPLAPYIPHTLLTLSLPQSISLPALIFFHLLIFSSFAPSPSILSSDLSYPFSPLSSAYPG